MTVDIEVLKQLALSIKTNNDLQTKIDYMAATNPETILALIEKIERLEKETRMMQFGGGGGGGNNACSGIVIGGGSNLINNKT